MPWWFIYERLVPLFIQCDNVYGIKVPTHVTLDFMKNLADGTQKVNSTWAFTETLTYCPTPAMNWLFIAAALGVLVCVVGMCLLMAYALERSFRTLPAPAALFASIFHRKPASDPTFDEIMQQLNKAAEDFLKQAK